MNRYVAMLFSLIKSNYFSYKIIEIRTPHKLPLFFVIVWDKAKTAGRCKH